MDYNFMNNPIFPGQQIDQNYANQPFMSSPPPAPPRMASTVGVVEEPKKPVTSSYGFTIVPDDEPTSLVVSTPAIIEVKEDKPKRKRKYAGEYGKQSTDIIKADKPQSEVVSSAPTIDTYDNTTMMLEEVIQQIDTVAVDLKEELDAVKLNRNARNRTIAIGSLGETLGRLLESKISAIREINSTISKSNEMDYKREKDLRSIQANMDTDDKQVMELYQALIKNTNNPQYNVMMPNPILANVSSIGGDGIVRSPIVSANNAPSNGEPVDIGYLNYLSRLTPEQNMMYYENDPNVQTVVVFDHSNGRKFFQVMNVATGQVIPNVPVLDQRFMDDTYLDMKSMTARNSNLNTTYPIVEINKGVESQY